MNLLTTPEFQTNDGFVDFYALLDLPVGSEAQELRERINALYKDARTDRNHRNLARRNEADLFMQLLPQARTVLLEPKRRRRYDAYRRAVEMQSPRMPFEEFLPSLLGDSEKAPATGDILAIASLAHVQRPTDATHATPSTIEPEVEEPNAGRPSFSLPIPLPALCGGAATFAGLLLALPVLAGVPLVLAGGLAAVAGAVATHVFSLAGSVADLQEA